MLLKIIRPGHPSYNKYASTLLGNRPTQLSSDSLESYLDKYLDWLQLRAYLENNPSNLNRPSELDNLLHGLQHGLEYLCLTSEERRSSDPIVQQKYSQGQIVGTLALKETLVDKRHSYSQSVTSASRTPASPSHSGVCFRSNPWRSEGSHFRRASTRTKSVDKVEVVPISQVDINRFLDNP